MTMQRHSARRVGAPPRWHDTGPRSWVQPAGLLLLLLVAAAAAEDPAAGAAAVSSPQKELLQPLEPQTTKVNLGTREHAAALLKEMARRWEGMDSPLSAASPWQSVSSQGPGLNQLPGGASGVRGTPSDPYNDRFGQFHAPPRGVPPPAMYSTFLFDPAHPFRRKDTPQSDPQKEPASDKWWSPLHGDRVGETQFPFPQQVLPIPRPVPGRPYADEEEELGRDRTPRDWIYQPIPYRARVERPERLPANNFGQRPVTYENINFHILNPRSLFAQHAPNIARAMAQSALRTGNRNGNGGVSLLQEDEQERRQQTGEEHTSTADAAAEAVARAQEAADRQRRVFSFRSVHGPANADQVKVPEEARSFRFATVHEKDRETYYPVGRYGSTLLRGSEHHSLRDEEAAALSRRRLQLRSVRENSVGARAGGVTSGPYGFGYNHQPGAPADDAPPALYQQQPDPSQAANPAYRFQSGPPLDSNNPDERPLSDEPVPLTRQFSLPAPTEVVKAPGHGGQGGSFVSVAERASVSVSALGQRRRGTVYASSLRRGGPSSLQPAATPTATSAPGGSIDKLTVKPQTELVASGPASVVPETNVIGEAPRTGLSGPQVDEVARTVLKDAREDKCAGQGASCDLSVKHVPAALVETTADAIRHPAKLLNYDLPWVKRAPEKREREFISSDEAEKPSLVETEAESGKPTAAADNRPWWENDAMVKENDERLRLSAGPEDQLKNADPSKFVPPMPGTMFAQLGEEAKEHAPPAAPAPAAPPALLQEAATVTPHLPTDGLSLSSAPLGVAIAEDRVSSGYLEKIPQLAVAGSPAFLDVASSVQPAGAAAPAPEQFRAPTLVQRIQEQAAANGLPPIVLA